MRKPIENNNTYRTIRDRLFIDFPYLFDRDAPKPLAFNIASQLVEQYKKELDYRNIGFFLSHWVQGIKYQKAILKHEYRYDLYGEKTKIEEQHKKSALKHIQDMLKPPGVGVKKWNGC